MNIDLPRHLFLLKWQYVLTKTNVKTSGKYEQLFFFVEQACSIRGTTKKINFRLKTYF